MVVFFYHSISAIYIFQSAQMFAFFSFFILPDQIAFELQGSRIKYTQGESNMKQFENTIAEDAKIVLR